MTNSESFVEAYARWVIRHRGVIVVVALALSAAASYGLVFLDINDSWRVFFRPDNDELRAFQELEQKYSRIDNVYYAVAPKEGDVFTVPAMQAIEALTKRSWQLPYTTRVDSITNFQYSKGEGDDIIVGNLVEDAKTLTPEQLKFVREVGLSEPLILHRTLSKDGKVAAVIVTVQLPDKTARGENVQTVAAARKLAAEIEQEFPNVRVYTTGLVLLNYAFREAALDDIRLLMPLMYVAILAIVFMSLRSAVATIITMSVVSLSTAAAEGIAGWLGINLTAPATTVPPLVMTLAVADSIHILMVARREMRDGTSRHEALVRSLVINMRPVVITSVTTIIGFLAMNFSESPPLWDVGNITSIGVALAFLYSVTLTPALVALLPMKPDLREGPPVQRSERFAAFVTRHYKVLGAMVTVIVLVSAALIPLNELNDQPLEYFDESQPFRQATDFVIQHMGSAEVVEYSLDSGAPEGIADPKYLMAVESFAEWFRKQPGVVHVNAITDTIKRLNKNMHGDDPDYYRIPDDRALAAQYLLFYEMSLPFGLDLNNQINVDRSATRFVVITTYLSSNTLRNLVSSGTQWLRDNAPPSMVTEASGSAIMFAHLAERNMKEMVWGTLTSLALVSAVMFIALRSFKYGLISIIPNFIPQIVAFGIWAVLIGKISFALSTVSSLSLGIIVDDTVHFLTHYVHARRHLKMEVVEAVRHCYVEIGTAIAATTVILCAGFLVLALSSFSFNRDMALLSAIVIVCAAAADGFYLPTLLLWIDRKRNPA